MSTLKDMLKNARTALSRENYDVAVEFAEDALHVDPTNYIAYVSFFAGKSKANKRKSLVFLGKGLEMMENFKRSQGAYTRATEVEPFNPLAWKGLLVIAGRLKSVPAHIAASSGLICCYQNSNEMVAAVQVFQNAKDFARKNTSDINEIAFLRFQLPESPIFEYMEGRLPHPSSTYSKLVSLYEKSEKQALSKYHSKSVSRLHAKDSKVTTEALYEIYSKSKLPELYESLLSWSNDEEERRSVEGKLLFHTYSTLCVAPSEMKAKLETKVRDMASGAVLLKTSDPLAWEIEIEWADVEDFKDYDQNLLLAYIDRFPDENLAKVLTGFLASEISPFDRSLVSQRQDESGKAKSKNAKVQVNTDNKQTSSSLKESAEGISSSENESPEEDDIEEIEHSTEFSPDLILELMSDGYSGNPNSLLASRILGAYYIRLREYETACDLGLKALDVMKLLKRTVGPIFPNSINHLESILGTAYVFYQAPKNYDLALQLFGRVLKSNPNYAAAKIGKGLIYREQSKFSKAKELLKSALDEEPDNSVVLFEYAWCQILQHDFEEGREGLLRALDGISGNDLLSHDYRAQIWWRIGQSYWLAQDSEQEYEQEIISALFGAFTSSLKENPNYAPTFTSLGKLYSTVLNDQVRATKCFYKAFEIDGGEIEAAEHLATEFADSMQWDLVEVVATRVIESERVRLTSGKEPSWPYRALGIASLNAHDYSKAVKCFQNAIRLAPEDANSWVGLGEAYTASGRYVAASKTFSRAQLLDSQNWIATYHLGMVQRHTQDYGQAIRTLHEVSKLKPDESNVKFALIETILMSARHELTKEVFGQAAILASACIKTANNAIESGLQLTQDLWKALSECCEIYLTVQSKIPDIPMDILVQLVKDNESIIAENEDMVFLSEIDGVLVPSLEGHESTATDDSQQGVQVKSIDRVRVLYILFLKLSFASARKDKSTRAIAWYNLGLGELRIFMNQKTGDNDKCLQASVDCFKRVIRLQSSNPDVWNAYGVACSYLNPKVAQHCFIRSLSLDSKQPAVWNNLALLYTQKGDLQLSEAAIGRSLIIDPDFVPAWIGQGIIFQTLGNAQDAYKSFEHSFKISNGMNKLSKLYYALSVFEKLQDNTNDVNLSEQLENSVLSLQKYLILSPESPIAITLQGLLLERVLDFEYAMEHASKLCGLYEMEYEETESQESLVKFVKAKAHLARVALGARQYEIAIEHAEFASDVASETSEQSEEIVGDLKKSRLSAFLTSGLGHYFLKDYSSAIECFKNALVESDEGQDVVVLLAQVLWAQGGDDEKEVALEQLFGSIEKSGASTKMALTLGAIGVVHDSDLIEAAEDELRLIPRVRLEKEDPNNHVPQMLAAMHNAKNLDAKEPWYRAAFYKPWDHDVWRHLEPKTALELAKSGESVSATELSTAYVNAHEGLETSLRAVYYSPWSSNAWDSLTESIA